MAGTRKESADTVDAVRPSVHWSYDVIIPPDGVKHTLSEAGFGWFAAGSPAGVDRAVRSITLMNRADQLPADISFFAGAPTWPLLLPFEIVPGSFFTFQIDKLSGLALANYSLVPVTATVALMAMTP